MNRLANASGRACQEVTKASASPASHGRCAEKVRWTHEPIHAGVRVDVALASADQRFCCGITRFVHPLDIGTYRSG